MVGDPSAAGGARRPALRPGWRRTTWAACASCSAPSTRASRTSGTRTTTSRTTRGSTPASSTPTSRGSALDVAVEESTSRGRLDMAVRFEGRVYVFEFKVVEQAGEGAAMAQLRDRGYADKYRAPGVTVRLVGVEFSSAARNVVAFEHAGGVTEFQRTSSAHGAGNAPDSERGVRQAGLDAPPGRQPGRPASIRPWTGAGCPSASRTSARCGRDGCYYVDKDALHSEGPAESRQALLPVAPAAASARAFSSTR